MAVLSGLLQPGSSRRGCDHAQPSWLGTEGAGEAGLPGAPLEQGPTPEASVDALPSVAVLLSHRKPSEQAKPGRSREGGRLAQGHPAGAGQFSGCADSKALRSSRLCVFFILQMCRAEQKEVHSCECAKHFILVLQLVTYFVHPCMYHFPRDLA